MNNYMLDFKNIYYYLLLNIININSVLMCLNSYNIMINYKLFFFIVILWTMFVIIGSIIKLTEILSPNVMLYHDSQYWIIERTEIVTLFNFPEKFQTKAEAIKRFNEIKLEIKQKKLNFFKLN